MCAETDSSEFLQTVLSEASTFDEVAPEFEDEVTCYKRLRDTAKTELASFDEYLEFYSQAIEGGPTDFVFYDLERNSTRSLKNMVLRSSQAGRRFPICSLSELQHRIKSYQNLGVESVTPRSVAFTVLEHIFDNEESQSYCYDIMNSLLSECSSSPSEIIEIFARARFVVATETLDTEVEALEDYFQSLSSDLPDPRPDDDRAASELLDAAEKRSYSDPEKVELVRSSLARQTELDALQEFLYLGARDVVERDRHKYRDDPWRGELQLALRQYNCITNLFGERLDEERLARMESYRQIVLSELSSGARWQSERDPNDLPEANFYSAAGHYLCAANSIRPVDLRRYIKYLSRAFRNQATATHRNGDGPDRGWLPSQQLHENAVEYIREFADSVSADEDLQETIIGTVASHRFRSYRASAVIAFERSNPAQVREYLDQAWNTIDSVPQYVEGDLLEDMKILANALESEQAGEYERALEYYSEVDNPKLDLDKRRAIVEVKSRISNKEYDQAINKAESTFEPNSPIVTAIQIVAGRPATSPSIRSSLEEISCIDDEHKWTLATYVHLISQSEDISSFSDSVENLLLEL